MNCIHHFYGAHKKGRAFIGWAGRVAEWPEKKAPAIDFGTWSLDKASSHNGGSVIFDCQPFDLVMYGANSPKMDPRDKTTKFGFAGLGSEGTLRIADLPKCLDARNIFAAGGWLPPSPDEIVGHLLSLIHQEKITASLLQEEIKVVMVKVIDGYGIHPLKLKFDETLAAWPTLSPIHHALSTAVELLAMKRSEAVTARLQQTQVEIIEAVKSLRGAGLEPTNTNIAAFLLNEPNHAAHCVKEKVRRLKKILGDEFFRVENATPITTLLAPGHGL